MAPFLKWLFVLPLVLSLAGCMIPEPPYPNFLRQDTTGNYGGR